MVHDHIASHETPKATEKKVNYYDKKVPEHLMALAFCRLDANRDLELDHQELRTYCEFCCPLVGNLNDADWYNLMFETVRTGLNLSERSLSLQQFEKLLTERQNLRATANKHKVQSVEFIIAQTALNVLSLPEGFGRKTILSFLNSPEREREHDDDRSDGGRWLPSGHWITEKLLLSRTSEGDLKTTVEERMLLGDATTPVEDETTTTLLCTKGINYGWELTWKLTEKLGCYVYISQGAAALKMEEKIRSWTDLRGTVFYRDGESRENPRNTFGIAVVRAEVVGGLYGPPAIQHIYQLSNILIRQRQWGQPPPDKPDHEPKTTEGTASASSSSSNTTTTPTRESGQLSNQQSYHRQQNSGKDASKGFGFTSRDNGDDDLFIEEMAKELRSTQGKGRGKRSRRDNAPSRRSCGRGKKSYVPGGMGFQ